MHSGMAGATGISVSGIGLGAWEFFLGSFG